jgi:hypothetical protein
MIAHDHQRIQAVSFNPSTDFKQPALAADDKPRQTPIVTEHGLEVFQDSRR